MWYGYIRVSTDAQAEHGHGLRVQEESVRAWAAAKGLVLAEVIADEGFSGSTLDRPGLRRLLDLVRQGAVSGVIIYKLDRLSRNLLDLRTVADKELRPHGCNLASVMEDLNTAGPMGQLFFNILGAFAEFERDVIRERMTGGRRSKAAKGGYAGGGAPIGYTATRGQKRLAIDEAKAEGVRRCLSLLDAGGLTLREIAVTLTEEGHTTAKGKPWGAVQVQRVRDRRSLYEGQYAYADVRAPGEHPVIAP